jgi:hypothetical protein
MGMKLLSQEEYQETLVPHMINVTESAEEIVDLWGYANPIIESQYHNCTAWEWKVHHIYETPDGKFQHIGIAVPKDDTYLVVIADKTKKLIRGHYVLSLGEINKAEEDNGPHQT